MKEVIIMSRRQAENMHLGHAPVISITGCAEDPATIKTEGELLRCVFEDYQHANSIPCREVTRIYGFLQRHQDDQQIIIHCHAGISRSAAVALFCAEKYHAHVDMRSKRPNLELVRMLREEHERLTV